MEMNVTGVDRLLNYLARPQSGTDLPKRFWYRSGLPSSLLREAEIAAGKCNTIRVTNGGHANNTNRHLQISYHPSNHSELLVVLLTEQRDIGGSDIE
jgi:hypothetical protein